MARTLSRLLQGLAIALMAVAVAPAHAGWNSMGKLNALPPMLNEKFGCSVAVDGNWMAVGSTDSTIGAARNTGSVHLFRNDNGIWVYRQSLSQESPLSFQAFGNALALRGDTLAVGSWGSAAFAGRVMVFKRDASDVWNLTATLAPGDAQVGKPALFGWSVSLDTPSDGSPVIVIGRPNDGASSFGAIYVFEFDGTTWNQVRKLSLPEPVAGDQLGTNVSVRGGTIVSGIARRRVATIFRRLAGAWSFDAVIRDAEFTSTDGFGSSVASGGTFVAVGAPSRPGALGLTKCGAAVVFTLDGSAWRQTATLALASPRSGDNFGYSLAACPTAFDGRPMIVAAAPGYDVPSADSGAAFGFSLHPTGWVQHTTDLWSEKAIAGQFMGKSAASSADGSIVALASELPRGSIGGAFPMRWTDSSSGSTATRTTDTNQGDAGGTGSGTSGGSTGSGASGGGASGGGGSGGDLSDGDPGNPNGSFGQGGRPRPLQPLPALAAGFGNVTDTVIVDAGAFQSVIGLQTDGVQRRGEPEMKVLASYPASWRLAATGDCNGDGSGDLIWQDDTRNIRVWLRDGTKYLAQNTLRPLAATESVVASVDFDGDGVQDVVTRDTTAKQVHVLRMRNGTPTTEWNIDLPSLDWNVLPQRLDIGLLMRHAPSGEVVKVTRNALSGAIEAASFPSPPPSAAIEGLGDIDGDGNPDMVTRDASSGELAVWRLDRRGNLIDARDTGLDGGRWRVEAMRDWDGNGCDDLLVSENGRGRLVVLSMHQQGGIVKILKSRVIGSTGGARVVDVTPR